MNAKAKITESFWIAFSFLAVIWLIYFVDLVLPVNLGDFGIRPRTLRGLVGIPLSPFLHASFGHLLSNSPALLILMTLLFFSQARPWDSLLAVTLLGGALTWVVARTVSQDGGGVIHIGASIVIFGLITFLIASGLWQRRVIGMIVATGVLFLYGGSLLWGVLPRINSPVSWEGHLCGAIAGIIVAWFARDHLAFGSNPSNITVAKKSAYDETPPVIR